MLCSIFQWMFSQPVRILKPPLVLLWSGFFGVSLGLAGSSTVSGFLGFLAGFETTLQV
jgi:small-conductance mechanosensitive channel